MSSKQRRVAGDDSWWRALAVGAWLVLLVAIAPSIALAEGGESSTGDATTGAASTGDKSADASPEHDLSSPRAAMFTFLEGINKVKESEDWEAQREGWQAVMATLDLSAVGADPNSDRARALARDLWGALNRISKIEPGDLPGNEINQSGRNFYHFFPRNLDDKHEWIINRIDHRNESIVLARQADGTWKFSDKTMQNITSLYRALKGGGITSKVDVDEADLSTAEPEPWLKQQMPESLKDDSLFNLEYWQWVGLLLIILLGVVLDFTLRFVLKSVTHRYIAVKHGQEASDSITNAMRPLGLTASGLLWLVLLPLLVLPETAGMVLRAAAMVFTVLAGTWAGMRITDLVCEVLANKAAKTKTKFDDVLIPLVRKTLKIFIVAFGLIYAAEALSIPVGPMLASLGIGGLAFAFAAKDTIENFFGSVAVILDRPFEVGDWIKVGDTEGTVEELGFRSTRVRTFYNSLVTVPNATLVRATVDNYGRRKYRRWMTHVGVQYDTTPDQLVAFTEGIRELVRTHPYTRKDYFQVRLHEFGASSLNILVYVFHEAPDWSTELRERERLFLDIIRLADKLGVQFAFPTTTVHLFQGQELQGPQHPSPERTTEKRAEITGIRAAQALVKDQPWQQTKPGPVVYQEGPTSVEIDPATGRPPDDDGTFIEDTRAGG